MAAVSETLKRAQDGLRNLGQSFTIPRRKANKRDYEGALVVSSDYLTYLQTRGESADGMLDVMGDWIGFMREEGLEIQAREEQAAYRDETRRAFLRRAPWLIGGVLGIGLFGLWGKACVVDPNSAEAWDAYQKKYTLGGEFTGVSARGWEVRYPKVEAGVSYNPRTDRNGYFFVDDKTYIDFERTGVISNHTGMKVGSEYKTTKQQTAPWLYILKPGTAESYNYTLLSPNPIDGLDTNVLEFLNVNSGQSTYAQLSKQSPNEIVYRVQLMDRQVAPR